MARGGDMYIFAYFIIINPTEREKPKSWLSLKSSRECMVKMEEGVPPEKLLWLSKYLLLGRFCWFRSFNLE